MAWASNPCSSTSWSTTRSLILPASTTRRFAVSGGGAGRRSCPSVLPPPCATKLDSGRGCRSDRASARHRKPTEGHGGDPEHERSGTADDAVAAAGTSIRDGQDQSTV